jgi:hypothetical protein
MYKTKDSNKCEFCPPKTYSNGTLNECLSCVNELSLLPGLYYKNWNELPQYLNRSYMSFDNPEVCMYIIYLLFIFNNKYFSFYLFKQIDWFKVTVGLVFVKFVLIQ